jgi:hypothetical protein
MTTVSAANPPATGNTTSGTRTALTAAGLVGALGSAGYIAGRFLLSGFTSQQTQTAPVTVTECLLTGLAYIAVAVMLPGLATVTRLPRWVLSLAAAGYAYIAIQAWVYGTLNPELASRLPAAEYEQIGQHPHFYFQLFELSTGVACVVSFIALAVVGWRRRAMSRGACVLFVLAGLASLLGPFPPVGLLAGLALAWTVRSAAPASQAS